MPRPLLLPRLSCQDGNLSFLSHSEEYPTPTPATLHPKLPLDLGALDSGSFPTAPTLSKQGHQSAPRWTTPPPKKKNLRAAGLEQVLTPEKGLLWGCESECSQPSLTVYPLKTEASCVPIPIPAPTGRMCCLRVQVQPQLKGGVGH